MRVTEATLKRELMRSLQTLLPDAVALRHEDRFISGIPDLSITFQGKTSWWECKYADPFCISSQLQRHLCACLARHGSWCQYIIFQRGIARPVDPRPRQIRVVNPEDFDQWDYLGRVLSDGRFDFHSLVRYFQEVHRS